MEFGEDPRKRKATGTKWRLKNQDSKFKWESGPKSQDGGFMGAGRGCYSEGGRLDGDRTIVLGMLLFVLQLVYLVIPSLSVFSGRINFDPFLTTCFGKER